MLFGEEALEYRLSNSGAAAIVTDEEGYEKVRAISARLPQLKHIFVVDGARQATASISIAP